MVILDAKLMRVYFDLIYNRVYDFTTAQFASYRRLHGQCIDLLEFNNGDKVLCLGIGTGNEIWHIVSRNDHVDIVGVDYSDTALRRAYRKASELGKEIKVFNMDARDLEFEAESFDKVICIHLMDFIDNEQRVTGEIFRVLKKGGQFVITYPTRKEGVKLGCNLLKDNAHENINPGKNRSMTLLKSLSQMLVGITYLPLLFRKKRKYYSRGDLEEMIAKLAPVNVHVLEEPVYQDFIVYGTKFKGGH